MKVLVLGAAGMAGHTIALYFKEQGHEVTAFSRKAFPYCKWIQEMLLIPGICRMS